VASRFISSIDSILPDCRQGGYDTGVRSRLRLTSSRFGTAMTAPRVFLSYAHADADKAFASALYLRLQRDGIACFFDEASLAPGANFVLKIAEALDACNYLVMVMSRAYFSASFTSSEWTGLLSDDPANERGRLVLLLREDCDRPALIRSLNYIDVSSADKLEQNYARILQCVRRMEPHDIEQRSREIDDLYDQLKVQQANKRMLDFARDFARQRSTLFRLTAIKWEVERTLKESDPRAGVMARVELLTEALNLKEQIINSQSLEAGA
jgi:hypothetical protein